MIQQELLKSHNDERLHDENKALDRIKSDPNYFFKYAKKFSKTATEVGPLLNANGVLVNDKRSMSEMLLKQFSIVCSRLLVPIMQFMTYSPFSMTMIRYIQI